MKLTVIEKNEKRSVEGPEARTVLKTVLKQIGESILLPIPPHTGVVRRRALDRLREGNAIWGEADQYGQPRGTILTMPPKVLGILKQDADGNQVFEAAEGLSAEQAQEIKDAIEAEKAGNVPPNAP